jgi:hypothetical protein
MSIHCTVEIHHFSQRIRYGHWARMLRATW